ncbi:MAG TPA: hypothetical protein VNH22_12375 [Blastocatellia bacterium]|jgi:hypothetical protein|nr:hypothetical protein [Blastocatellia bacterium]
MTKNKTDPERAVEAWTPGVTFQGWASIAFWMIFGLLLEGFLGYKIPGYLEDGQRRELFRLAHTHGTFLGLVLVAAALCGKAGTVAPPRLAIAAIRAGAILMPLGFFLAGIWHPEGDPGLAIWLVPPSALLVIFGAISLGLSTRRKDPRP